MQLKPFELGLTDDKPASIEQWLRSFADAEYVITDSYHGLVFSIIFNKPFHLIRNKFRGNARFESLLMMFSLSEKNNITDSKMLGETILNMRIQSNSILRNQLKRKVYESDIL